MSRNKKIEPKFLEITMLKTRLSEYGTLRIDKDVMLPYEVAMKLVEEGYAKIKSTNYI